MQRFTPTSLSAALPIDPMLFPNPVSQVYHILSLQMLLLLSRMLFPLLFVQQILIYLFPFSSQISFSLKLFTSLRDSQFISPLMTQYNEFIQCFRWLNIPQLRCLFVCVLFCFNLEFLKNPLLPSEALQFIRHCLFLLLQDVLEDLLEKKKYT